VLSFGLTPVVVALPPPGPFNVTVNPSIPVSLASCNPSWLLSNQT
jgi:hypothetical protein